MKKIPSSYTILFFIIFLMVILTWIIPAGQYDVNKAKELIPGTFHYVMQNQQGLWDIIKAPVIGMMGDDKTSAAIPVSLFLLVVGGFLGVINATNSLNAGISSIVKRYQGREKQLIVVLMILFSLGGTTFGMSEETLVFYPLLLPVMYSIGLDSLVAVGVILIGSTVGVLASTVNPFATGVASQAAGISPGQGILWRLILWVLLTSIAIFYVYHYAQKIEKDPRKSLVYAQREKDIASFKLQEIDSMNKTQKKVITLFILTFIVMIISLIPWESINTEFTFFTNLRNTIISIPFLGKVIGTDIPAFGSWYFTEITILFIFMSVVIGYTYRMDEGTIVKYFVNGAKDMVQVALIVAIARGIQVVMNDGMITATILHFGETTLSHLPPILFVILTYLFYIPMSFLVYSTSGLASASMGIMSNLAEFVHVPKDLIITAFQAGSGTMNLVNPASAIMLGVLGIAHIEFITWVKFTAKLLGIIFIVVCLVLITAMVF
ncbi:YfcC family protein, partial [Enterococcus faecalis]|nr:YfcC family protein [Enterococcus faecalis]